jgi:Cdc6-like AAA superfamily ATPase
MLPARPQIFHGRDSELAQTVRMLHQEYAKIAILGAGGMGKTSLARAALHHPDVTTKYGDRFFVSCESATTHTQIAAAIGAHLGLKPEENLTKSVLRSLSGKPTCLLILDNLETTWEPLESRSGVEDLISLLTDLPHLALIVSILYRGLCRHYIFGDYRLQCEEPNTLPGSAGLVHFLNLWDHYHMRLPAKPLLKLLRISMTQETLTSFYSSLTTYH